MKELRIPVQSENVIDVSEIDRNFSGLIIGYKDRRMIGYIQYKSGDWRFLSNIDAGDYIDWKSNLLDLITCLIESKECNHFKIMEFSYEDN